jgi:large subunit ribosomal protein L14e
MAVFEVGRVAVKTLGHEAGRYCVVVEVIDKNFVLVDGLFVHRRRSNVAHLAPTKEKVELKKGASTEEVKKAVDKAKFTEKFKGKVALGL